MQNELDLNYGMSTNGPVPRIRYKNVILGSLVKSTKKYLFIFKSPDYWGTYFRIIFKHRSLET